MEFELHRTMDQVSWLDLGSYFHSAMLVTTSWSCFMLLGHHWLHSQSLLWPPVLVPSHPGPALFSPCWTHSLVLTWFPWNCRINGICCLDSTPLQITTLWALHSVYNDKVCEISEVVKLLDRSLDCQYTRLRCTDIPLRFKQDNLCRVELLDNFLDNTLLKLWSSDLAQRQLEVDMKATYHSSCHLVPLSLPLLKCDISANFNAALTGGIFLYSAQYVACMPSFMLVFRSWTMPA